MRVETVKRDVCDGEQRQARLLWWLPLVWSLPAAFLLLTFLQPLMQLVAGRMAVRAVLELPPWPQVRVSSRASAVELPWQDFQPQGYTVRVGDTLDSIASRFDVEQQAVITLNKLETRFIRPGEQLLLPNLRGVFHRVRRGESLLGLAREYGVSMVVLLDTNDIRQPRLQVGQELFIPQDLQRVTAVFPSFSSPFSRETKVSFANRIDDRRNSQVFLFPVHYGEAVLAVAGGQVTAVGAHPQTGYYLLLRHPQGWMSVYGHLAAVRVSVGEVVEPKQQVALVGRDPEGRQPSLYFSLYREGRPLEQSAYPPDFAQLCRQLGAVGVGRSPFKDKRMRWQ